MKNIKRTTQLLLLSISIIMMVACSQQTPIRIFVTPTPADTATTTATNDFTASPTVTEQLPTAAAVLPSELPPPTQTFIGALVGPSYTPPATMTPLPTIAAPTDAPAFTPTWMPVLDATTIGIQVDPNVTSEDWIYLMDRVSQLGVQWIKIQFNWNFYQPNGPDEWSVDMQRIELYLFEAQRRNLNVIVSIAKAPAWARTDRTEDGPPDDPQVLANFISFMASGGPQEYNLWEQIDAIEIWNEPNLAREWRGQSLDGGTYMRYFTLSYNAIRAVSPSMPIITAGLAPTGNGDVSRDDREFLSEMYGAGLGQYQDIYVGAHPFPWGNSPDARCCDLSEEFGWDDRPQFFFLDTIEDYREIMTANGHTTVQLWITEFGWASWDGFTSQVPEQWMTYTDRHEQGQHTLRAFQIGQERDDIHVMILWNLNFANSTALDQSQEVAAYALMPVNGIRPVFWMVQDAISPTINYSGYDMPG